jgi:hypothetical protein
MHTRTHARTHVDGAVRLAQTPAPVPPDGFGLTLALQAATSTAMAQICQTSHQSAQAKKPVKTSFFFAMLVKLWQKDEITAVETEPKGRMQFFTADKK